MRKGADESGGDKVVPLMIGFVSIKIQYIIAIFFTQGKMIIKVRS